MVNVKCIKEYNDLKLDRVVKVGEVIEVADARATVLVKANVAEVVTNTEIPKKEDKKPTKKPTKKKEA